MDRTQAPEEPARSVFGFQLEHEQEDYEQGTDVHEQEFSVPYIPPVLRDSVQRAESGAYPTELSHVPGLGPIITGFGESYKPESARVDPDPVSSAAVNAAPFQAETQRSLPHPTATAATQGLQNFVDTSRVVSEAVPPAYPHTSRTSDQRSALHMRPTLRPVDVAANAPAPEAETQVTPGAVPGTPSHGNWATPSTPHSSQYPGNMTVSEGATSHSVIAGATNKKKKQSEMSKQERRLEQERQREQKKLKENQNKKPATVKNEGEEIKKRAPKDASRKGNQKGSKLHPLDMFSHLPQYQLTSPEIVVNMSDKLDQVILELGLAYSQRSIVGSSARTIAMMAAMHAVVRDFSAPPNQAFSRALLSHINLCVSFLWDECRPACVPQRNSIKWLKSVLQTVPTSDADADVRKRTLKAIDNFINEKFIFAEQLIVKHACGKIENGDIIVTYGYSQVIKNILLKARKEGKKFRVLVVDARPVMSGEKLCCKLLNAGIQCSYMPLNALSHNIKSASKVLLGASAVKGNGAVVARGGSALVAMAATNALIPVLICAQSIKFHDEVQLDSITSNERGDPQGILSVNSKPEVTKALSDGNANGKRTVLNLTYDVMPIDFVTLVVTEFGLIPPTSIPVILREKRDDEMIAGK